MAILKIELSQSCYRPGDTVCATITIAQQRNSGQQTFASSAMSSHRKERSNSLESKQLHNEFTSESRGLQSPELHSPRTPTTPSDTAKYKRGHKKSVSFSPMTSPVNTKRNARLSNSMLNDKESACETLLIVYAQLVGTFQPDSRYFDPQKFEKIKNQGLHGSSAGGVVSNNSITNSRWSFSNWSTLLTTSQPSSLADIRHSATTKTFPVVSMPPSIVHVQVRLEDDMALQKIYSINLPNSLPMTYSGKTIDIFYVLRISAQRADHSVTTFECPIIVAGEGNDLYDFTCPHLLKQSPAQITDDSYSKQQPPSISSKGDFLELLSALRDDDRPLPSPIEDRKQLHPYSTTLLRPGTGQSHGLRFEVSRGEAEHVCKVVLQQSNCGAGEVIFGSLDFEAAQLQCYQCTISLEVTETIEAPFAVLGSDKTVEASSRILSRDQIVTACSIQASFEIGVPLGTTNSFVSAPFALKHSLLFEFLLHNQEQMMIETRTRHGIDATPSEQIQGELFECRIPFPIAGMPKGSQARLTKIGTI